MYRLVYVLPCPGSAKKDAQYTAAVSSARILFRKELKQWVGITNVEAGWRIEPWVDVEGGLLADEPLSVRILAHPS